MLEYKEAARSVIMTLGCLVIFLSLLPLIKSDKWFVRMFDYPRFQKFWINLLLLASFVPLMSPDQTVDWLYAGAAIVNQIYLFLLIRPYTRLAAAQMQRNPQSPGKRIRLFVANVFQDNRETAGFFRLIKTEDPDIIVLVETDQWWAQATKELSRSHPHSVLIPLSNTYGMLLYSRIAIKASEVRYLTDPETPSVKADMQTEDGYRFRFYALHPKPPVPQESTESTQRDAEILIVGKEAKTCGLPVIVAGDLNDVAWSHTTRLFLRVSELLDPRIGRGFYSTFHARHPLMRWPLDHFFCSSHFYLISLRRMPDIGSDHFPILLDVSMMPEEVKENDANEKQATKGDQNAADKKIEKAYTHFS